MAEYETTAPWERQPGETAKAFEAFSVYRDMGTDQSITKVALSLNKSRAIIGRWSSHWEWASRVRAWDNDLVEAARKQARKDIEEMQQRHIAIGRLLQDKAVEAIESGVDISARDATALAKLGVDVERLARGEATERIEGKSEISGAIGVNNPFEGFTPDELRKLIAVTEADDADDSGA